MKGKKDNSYNSVNGEDAFEKEAQEGFDMLGEQELTALKEKTDKRFAAEIMRKKNGRRIILRAAAALIILLASVAVYYLFPPEKNDLALRQKASENTVPAELSVKNNSETAKPVIQEQKALQPEQAAKSEESPAKSKALKKSEPVTGSEAAETKQKEETGNDFAVVAAPQALKSDADQEMIVGTNSSALAAGKRNVVNTAAGAAPEDAAPSPAYSADDAKYAASPQKAYVAEAKKKSVNVTSVIPSCYYLKGDDSLKKKIRSLLLESDINIPFEASMIINHKGLVTSARIKCLPRANAFLETKIEKILIGIDGFALNGKTRENDTAAYVLRYEP